MPDNDRRFKITSGFVIEEIKGDTLAPFFEVPEVIYHDVPYDGMVAIEAAVGELIDRLGDFGFDSAEAQNLGQKLKALGLTKKNK